MQNPIFTLAISILLLIFCVSLYAAIGKGVDFFPDHDPEQAAVNLRLPQGSNITETDRLTRIVEERLKPFRNNLQHVVANVGSSGGEQIFTVQEGGQPHLSSVTLVFKDFEKRTEPSTKTVRDVRDVLTDIAGAEVRVQREESGPPTGGAVTVRIAGDDFSVLTDLSRKAQGLIADVPGLVNLRSDFEDARPELVFTVDRQRAMLLGVNTALIGGFLQTAIFGTAVSKFRDFNDEYDITIRLPLSHRIRIEDILDLRVPNRTGQSIPLTSLGVFAYRGGFGTIHRIDQRRVITLTADAEGRPGPQVLQDVQERLKQLTPSTGYFISYAGEREEQDKAIAFLRKAFVIGVMLIVMILVTQFNSFRVPLIIMTTVILSLIGVLLGLIVTQTPFGIIMTGIGVICLAGVVVNNAIVLLAYTRRLEEGGMSLIEAAVQAGRTRLRPVLLTAATTILGLTPMAVGVSFDFRRLEWSVGSLSNQMWRSMAIAVVFGLAFATILTLVVVPAFYVLTRRKMQAAS